MPYLKTKNNIDVYYETCGSGEPMLFIHGWGTDSRIWAQQRDYFNRSFSVITVDLPGHGKSTFKQVGLRDIAEDIAMLGTELGFNNFSLVGSSLGGLATLQFADMFPEKTKRIILVGSSPQFFESDDFTFGLTIQRIQKLSEQIETDYPSILNIFFRSLFTAQERKTSKIEWLLKFRPKENMPKKEALQHFLNIIQRENLRPALKRISVPVKFINGTHDYISTKESIIQIKKLFSRVKIDFIEGCGHFPFLTKSQIFNASIEEFMLNDNR